MFETQSLTVTLMAEALLAFSTIAVVLAVLTFRRKNRERQAITALIEKLASSGSTRNQDLKAVLSQNQVLDEMLQDSVLEEIRHNEKKLYQQIISTFINRDAEMLRDLHQRVDELTAPYLSLMKNAMHGHPAAASTTDTATEDEAARQDDTVALLKSQNSRLSEQLGLALETMDEVSTEYTKMFGNEEDAKELESSKRRMLEIFNRAIHKGALLPQADEPEEAVAAHNILTAAGQALDREPASGNRSDEIGRILGSDTGLAPPIPEDQLLTEPDIEELLADAAQASDDHTPDDNRDPFRN